MSAPQKQPPSVAAVRIGSGHVWAAVMSDGRAMISWSTQEGGGCFFCTPRELWKLGEQIEELRSIREIEALAQKKPSEPGDPIRNPCGGLGDS